jgi:prepilin-type N-terminal cleavage/methylation domain-containing protein
VSIYQPEIFMQNLTKTLKRNAQAGFTLIELIIVIVVIGILAAIAIPRFTDLTDSAKHAALQAVAANLNTAATVSYAKSKSTGSTPVGCASGLLGLVVPDLSSDSSDSISGTTSACVVKKGTDTVTFVIITD